MIINGPDKIVVQQQLNMMQRRDAANQRMVRHMEEKKKDNETRYSSFQDGSSDYEEVPDITVEEIDVFLPQPEPEPTKETFTDLTYFVAECVHYDVSDRGAAALYNAALRTRGDFSETTIVDKSKIRQEKEKFAVKEKVKRKESINNSGGLKCIGADGK